MIMITCTRRLEWDAAHRVLRHESKCATLHGHRYRAEITCAAIDLDSVGRIVDFSVVKERIGGWIDRYLDHTTIVNAEDHDLIDFCTREHAANEKKKRPYVIEGEPTAENIASLLVGVGAGLLSGKMGVEPGPMHRTDSGVWITRVRVYETPNCWADAVVA